MNAEPEHKNSFWQTIRALIFLKAKFALSSLVATLADYSIYLLLVNKVFNPTISNIISAGCGMIINFLLQKKYVFELKRKVITAFQLSVLVSLGGIALSTLIVTYLSSIDFFNNHQYVTKLIATGVVFFYNFYLKRFVFEKRFI